MYFNTVLFREPEVQAFNLKRAEEMKSTQQTFKHRKRCGTDSLVGQTGQLSTAAVSQYLWVENNLQQFQLAVPEPSHIPPHLQAG